MDLIINKKVTAAVSSSDIFDWQTDAKLCAFCGGFAFSYENWDNFEFTIESGKIKYRQDFTA